MSTSTITSVRRPLAALAKAEALQLLRNRTLLTNATVFPIGVALVMYVVGLRQSGASAGLAALGLEVVVFTALLFVQYYSVLSMVTTRRAEGVLKRLRTGEAEDWQILSAPAIPGAALTLANVAVVAVVVYATGSPAPANVVALLVALVGGLVLYTALALVTAAFTKNAEAAQVTSLPVIMLSVLGYATVRGFLPDGLAAVADVTPFAAVSDLVFLGAAGKVPGADGASLDLAGTFGAMVGPVATLVAWTVLALVLARRWFRWDQRG